MYHAACKVEFNHSIDRTADVFQLFAKLSLRGWQHWNSVWPTEDSKTFCYVSNYTHPICKVLLPAVHVRWEPRQQLVWACVVAYCAMCPVYLRIVQCALFICALCVLHRVTWHVERSSALPSFLGFGNSVLPTWVFEHAQKKYGQGTQVCVLGTPKARRRLMFADDICLIYSTCIVAPLHPHHTLLFWSPGGRGVVSVFFFCYGQPKLVTRNCFYPVMANPGIYVSYVCKTVLFLLEALVRCCLGLQFEYHFLLVCPTGVARAARAIEVRRTLPSRLRAPER